MADLELVQGDSGLPITGQILKVDNTPRDLTGADVKFQMRKPDDKRYTVDAVATVTNESEGRVSYELEENDLSVPGDYIAQWEVTYSDNAVQTTDPPNTVVVRRQ